MSQFDDDWKLLISARTWLAKRAYRLIDSAAPEGMEQGGDVYAGDRLGIRIVADRGQWFVDVCSPSTNVDARRWQGWFGLEAWSVCLGTPILFHDTRPTASDEDRLAVLANSWWLEPQLDYLRDNLTAIERACSTDALQAALACVEEAQRKGSGLPARRRP